MDKIVFTLEFDDTLSNQHANEYLAKGWTLISVGTVCVGTLAETGQADYQTSYVVGANSDQYEAYKRESNESETAADKLINQFK